MSLDKALLLARKAMNMPTKNSTAQVGARGNYKYADLAEVLDVVTQPLSDNGILLRQYPQAQEGSWILITELTHAESGETRTFPFPLLVAKQDAQGFGSSITYARRYSLLGLLALSPEDDDGKKACEPAKPHQESLKTVSMKSVESRNTVAQILSLLTTNDADIANFLTALGKKNTTDAQWEALVLDDEKLKGYFHQWKAQQGASRE